MLMLNFILNLSKSTVWWCFMSKLLSKFVLTVFAVFLNFLAACSKLLCAMCLFLFLTLMLKRLLILRIVPWIGLLQQIYCRNFRLKISFSHYLATLSTVFAGEFAFLKLCRVWQLLCFNAFCIELACPISV